MPHTWTCNSDDEMRRMAIGFANQMPYDPAQWDRIVSHLNECKAWVFEGKPLPRRLAAVGSTSQQAPHIDR
jgi:hypothetical protein